MGTCMTHIHFTYSKEQAYRRAQWLNSMLATAGEPSCPATGEGAGTHRQQAWEAH